MEEERLTLWTTTRMKFKVVASGSKGNCTVVLCDNTNLIIDMGISYLTLKRSLEENSLSFEDFSGILVTHCHKDHTKGLASLIKHTKLNAYIPQGMYDSLKEYISKDRCVFIDDYFKINDVSIELIHTSHDAPSSVGFIIYYQDRSLVYVTDTGYINRKYLARMVGKDAYVIESNHDEKMLMDGSYPRFLKERIISDNGHLSNTTTAKYLSKLVTDNTKHIVLAHLSHENNTEELALNTLKEYVSSENKEIIIARQEEETKLIEV